MSPIGGDRCSRRLRMSLNIPRPFRDVVTRIETQEQQKPAGERTVIASLAQDGLLPQEGSVLVLGGPESRPGHSIDPGQSLR